MRGRPVRNSTAPCSGNSRGSELTTREGEAAMFPTTAWSAIRSAGAGQSVAVNALVERYRPSVVGFVRRLGLDATSAEDVAQEVFLRLLDDRVLVRADRGRGRFRSLLLAVTRQVV